MTKRIVRDPVNVRLTFQLRVRRAVQKVLNDGQSKAKAVAEFNKGRK